MLSFFYEIGNLPQQSPPQFAKKPVRGGGGVTQGSSFPAPARQVVQVVPSHKDFFVTKTQQDHLTPKVLDPVEIWSLGHTPVNFLQLTKNFEFYPEKNAAAYIKNGFMKGIEL